MSVKTASLQYFYRMKVRTSGAKPVDNGHFVRNKLLEPGKQAQIGDANSSEQREKHNIYIIKGNAQSKFVEL